MSLQNNLQAKFTTGGLCKAFGIRLVTNPSIVQLAYNAGFDAVFIDLEHSTLSIDDASRHSMFATILGVTPFVRVPYQCGNGFVQRVLDGGAMGVVFPHIHNSEDAKAAVAISKYPTAGCRSMTGQLPLFNLKPTPANEIIEKTNAHGSTVILMIETRESIEKVDEIAAVDGVDVLLIGSNDLSIELGVPGGFQTQEFRTALELVSTVCKKHGKTFGLAGIYDAPEIQDWALNTLGARFILGQQDSGLIAREGKRNAQALDNIFKG
ncbi:hypothetical protein FAVG1_04833 [Fusarium avenaceum]|nr:hypothetical protein FAVG1_04833 [Fusarium avenaceum]